MSSVTTPTTRPAFLRLGTRSSLLAIAQSRLVAAQLMLKHPGLHIELVEMQSRGDKDQNTPLSCVSDTDFFSDELDAALACGDVDFCVHSWKDIDGPRPDNFVRAAVPARALPHDAVLFRSDIHTLLERGTTLRIGTCSLRRQINTADFLRWALPDLGHPPRFEFHDLRGPVDERLARITASAGNKRLDAVVLALAGLERLWQDSDGRQTIEPLLRDARWMIMPLSECPAAPAQGALALETLKDNQHCRALLQSLHDPETEKLVQLERQLISAIAPRNSGFGATAESDPLLGHVARLRGRADAAAEPVYLTRTAQTSTNTLSARPWQAASWQRATRKRPLAVNKLNTEALFIAHADAHTPGLDLDEARCWTSGPHSWKQLAKRGIWVEGCADNRGFELVKPLLAAPVLQLPPLSDWMAITHADALVSWSDSGVGKVIPTYCIDVDLDPMLIADEVATCTHFYWVSARQYRALSKFLPANASHACGTGKTFSALAAQGVPNLRAFPSRREWQQWLG